MKLNVFCLIFIFSQAIIRVAQPCTLRYCVTASRVNIRAWPCGSIIGSGYRNRCFSHRGGERRCYLRHLRRYVPYVPIQFGSRVAWAARNLMRLDKNCPPPPPPPVNHNPCGNYMVSRAGWGARAPKHITGLSTPVRTVIIHHSVSGRCYTGDQCKANMRSMQNFHMNTRRWSDIGYNFAIGGDNKVYEGRGWTKRGAHAGSWCNRLSIAIALIGNFDTAHPPASMIQLAKNLINCGIKKGYIVPWDRLSILGHKDVCARACPGRHLYSVISHWTGFRRTVPCRC